MAFKVPAKWYANTIERLTGEELPGVLGELDRTTAWKYVAACVTWADEIDKDRKSVV